MNSRIGFTVTDGLIRKGADASAKLPQISPALFFEMRTSRTRLLGYALHRLVKPGSPPLGWRGPCVRAAPDSRGPPRVGGARKIAR